MRRKVFALLSGLFVSVLSVQAANVTLPVFQLLTRGVLEDSQFTLSTQADVDVEFGGGYKFGGRLALSIESSNLEEPTTLGPVYDPTVLQAALNERLSLTSASVIVRDLFGAPIDLTYFIGQYDRFLNGDIFPERFGTGIIGSGYRGLLFFPNGIAYDGMYMVDGTGLALGTESLAEWLYLEAAIYQDAYLGPGFYSSDLRVVFNFPSFKAEAFAGASFPQASYGVYRGGLLLYYSPTPGSEFLAEVGLPYIAPGTHRILDEDLFILFEPRVYIGIVSLSCTVFWHPAYYQHVETGEGGETDILVRIVAGNMRENVFSGGVEGAVFLPPGFGTDQLEVTAAPFVTIASSGVLWDFKVNFNLLPFSLADLFEVYIGVRTEF
jgi:hypothetical protein